MQTTQLSTCTNAAQQKFISKNRLAECIDPVQIPTLGWPSTAVVIQTEQCCTMYGIRCACMQEPMPVSGKTKKGPDAESMLPADSVRAPRQ